VIIFLGYFTRSDDGFLKKPKHVAITSKIPTNVALIVCPYYSVQNTCVPQKEILIKNLIYMDYT
jgi:hypothetical protein